jgi:HlyD family secretion protein
LTKKIFYLKGDAVLKKILIIFLISFFMYNCTESEKKNSDSNPKTAKIISGNIRLSVSSTGVIEPKQVVEIKSKASGEIITLPFDEGDFVKQGELLAELDPADEERNLLKAQAGLIEAQANLEISKTKLEIEKINYANSESNVRTALLSAKASYDEAESKFRRNKELFANNLISKEELENSNKVYVQVKSQYEQAKADEISLAAKKKNIEIIKNNIKTSEASFTKAKLLLEDAQERKLETKIYSTLDGVILSREVSTGQIVSSATSNVGGGSLLMSLADISDMYVVADIDESDIGRIEENQEVSITVDAYKDKIFEGVVERIKPLGIDVSNVTVFKVKIKITDEDKELLLPNMTANLEIIIDNKENILMIPFQALKSRKRTKGIYLKKADGKPEFIEVETGINNGEYIEISGDNIKEGMDIFLELPGSGSGNGNNGKNSNNRDMRRGMRAFR